MWIEDLVKKGVNIYSPNPQEMKEFRDTAQSKVIPFIRSKIGGAWVDNVMKAVEEAEKEYYENEK